jgi:hypothetical protein
MHLSAFSQNHLRWLIEHTSTEHGQRVPRVLHSKNQAKVKAKPTMIDEEASDIGALWEQALNQYFLDTKDVLEDYYVDTGKNTKSLPQRTWKVSSIINDQEQQLEDFRTYRHNQGVVDKLRSVVRRNSDIIQSVAQLVSEAASAV